jgi:proteasome alpha subunit
MLTPYDWQEGIGHRAQYVENKLAQGSPVLAVSIEEGILILTLRRNVRKVFEIYDRLAYAAVGQQSDIEALRVAAIDFAHQEGFNRSEQDVTIQRVVNALSNPIKKAFGDFSTSPFVARLLFAEVGVKPENDSYAVLDFDGDYATRKRFAFVANSEESASILEERLNAISGKKLKLDKAQKELEDAWRASRPEDATDEGLGLEAVLLERSDEHENRFRVIALPEE